MNIITAKIGVMGCAAAVVFTSFGAAYGTAKSGVGICASGVMRPELIMKNVVAPVMAGIIGIYGLVVAALLSSGCIIISYILFSHTHISSGHQDEPICRFHSARCWAFCWTGWPCCGIHYWRCWRRWSTRIRPTAQIVCRHDLDSYLCGSLGILASHI